MKKRKILQVGKFYPVRGGVEKVMYDAMTGLSERGVDCDMLCAAEKGPSRRERLNEHANIICTKTVKKAYATMLSPDMVLRMRQICNDYDVVHVHHPDPMAALALRLSGYKGKVVVHWHSDIEKQKKLLKLFMPLQNWMLRRADVIVGTSPVYLKESAHLSGVQEKTVCVPIGINPVEPDPQAVERIRNTYPGKKIVFSLGRLVPYKGYRNLVAAAAYLSDEYVILIGGAGPLKDELQADIERLGLQDKVKLLGFISDEDLPAYFGACKLFCLSSVQKTEAFAIVQIETFSCGKPVVATNIPHSGVPWVNAHGKSGLNVEPNDPEGLARAITTLGDNDDVYMKLSKGALRRFNELFTRDRMIDNLMNIYNDL